MQAESCQVVSTYVFQWIWAIRRSRPTFSHRNRKKPSKGPPRFWGFLSRLGLWREPLKEGYSTFMTDTWYLIIATCHLHLYLYACYRKFADTVYLWLIFDTWHLILDTCIEILLVLWQGVSFAAVCPQGAGGYVYIYIYICNILTRNICLWRNHFDQSPVTAL